MRSAAKQKMVNITPYFLQLAYRMINNKMYSMDVKAKLYTKSTPSVKYDNAKPHTIEEMCRYGCGMSTASLKLSFFLKINSFMFLSGISQRIHLLACDVIRNATFQKRNGRKYLKMCCIEGHAHVVQISVAVGS